MIFAVFDPSPLTVCINCSFYRQHFAQRKAPVFKLLRGRFWGFSPRRSDTLNRLWWNLALMSTPNFTPIDAKLRV